MARKVGEVMMGGVVTDGTPEEVLEKARKLIGAETEPIYGRYPVEYDAIRRYCHMTEDINPLFLDPEYAKKTKHGEVVCPPLLISYFASPGPGTERWPPVEKMPRLPLIPVAGLEGINLTTEWQFFKPVKVGDRLSSYSRFADIYIKKTSRDPKCFWRVTERVIENQNGEKVAVGSNTLLHWRGAEQLKEEGEA